MRRLALAALLLLAHGGAAAAEPNPDAPRRLTARLVGTQVVFTATYVVPIDTPMIGIGTIVDLPPRGVAIGARVWNGRALQPLRLRPAAEAARRFDAAWEGTGRGAPGVAVLLSARAGAVDVTLVWPTPVPLRLEIDVAVPTCAFAGARHAPIPEAWAPGLHVAPASEALLEACGDQTPTWYALPARARADADHLVVSSGRLALDAEHVAKVEVGATTLSTMPRDLATVILVDGSRSLSEAQRAVQAQLVQAYARAAPTSRLQVIAYDRGARPLLPGWTTAAQAAPVLSRALADLPARNGSSLDRGLAEATTWLARTRGTRRVVVLTDELLADRLTTRPAADLARGLPPGTLVHVVAIDPAGDELDRDDEALLAPLAAATAGMALRIGAHPAGAPIDALRLVRPTSLDSIAITGPGWTMFDAETGLACVDDRRTIRDLESVAEGAACSWWATGTPTAGAVTLTGWLWGRRITRTLQPAPAHAVAIARELSTAAVPGSLREQVERAARAINSQWSLLATWGGAGPSVAERHGGTGDAGLCCGTAGTIGHGSRTGTRLPDEDLRAQVRPLLASCGVARDTLAIELELTLTEIVDVRVTLTPSAGDAAPAAVERRRTCVEEALWTMTPTLRTVRPHYLARVDLAPQGPRRDVR